MAAILGGWGAEWWAGGNNGGLEGIMGGGGTMVG